MSVDLRASSEALQWFFDANKEFSKGWKQLPEVAKIGKDEKSQNPTEIHISFWEFSPETICKVNELGKIFVCRGLPLNGEMEASIKYALGHFPIERIVIHAQNSKMLEAVVKRPNEYKKLYSHLTKTLGNDPQIIFSEKNENFAKFYMVRVAMKIKDLYSNRYPHIIIKVDDSELAELKPPKFFFLGCADSRTSPEIVSNLNKERVSCCRHAGSSATKASIESIKLFKEIYQNPKVIIAVHESCGAIKAAANHAEGFEKITSHIQKSIETAPIQEVNEIARHHAIETAHIIKESIPDIDIFACFHDLQKHKIRKIALL